MTPPPLPSLALPTLRHGQVLLVYTPDGPLGGTFTCTGCTAQAWQPDLLVHAAACPFIPAPDPAPTPRSR